MAIRRLLFCMGVVVVQPASLFGASYQMCTTNKPKKGYFPMKRLSMRYCVVLLAVVCMLICHNAMAASESSQPFSKHMKKAELVFIGTLTGTEYGTNGTRGLLTDLTFRVDKLIKGEPNINADTVTFCIPGGIAKDAKTGKLIRHESTMGDAFANLEVDSTFILMLRENEAIASWMPKRDGLYPVSPSHGVWSVTTKKVKGVPNYYVHMWATGSERLKTHFLAIPLESFVELLEASKIYGDKVDPIVALISDAIVKGELRGILPDSDEATAVQAEVTKQIGVELAKLKANSEQAPTKGGKK